MFPVQTLSHFRLRAATVVAGLAVGAISTAPAGATAIFDASATAFLEITSIGNLDTPGDLTELLISGDGITFPFEDTFGTATATADGMADVIGDPLDLGVGDGLDLRSEVAGTADPVGDAEAEHVAIGLIDILNLSVTDTFEIGFELTYSLDASASVDDPVLEDALVFAGVAIFDDSGFVDELFEVSADALFGPPSDDLADVFLFDIVVGPSEVIFIDLFTDTFGFASAIAVPEPGTFALFVVGLAGLGVMVRLRRREQLHQAE